MAKIIVKIVSVWLFFFLLFISFAVYRDLKVKKVFNYSSPAEVLHHEKSLEIEETEKNVVNSYAFTVKSQDDYLGAVIFPLKDFYHSNDGTVVFRIKEKDAATWYAENTFTIDYFKDFGQAIYGIPPISDSNGKEYVFEAVFVGDTFGTDATNTLLDKIQLKYVFPRTIALDSPQILMSIISHRLDGIINVFSRIEFIYFLSLSTFITMLIFFLNSKDTIFQTLPLMNIPIYKIAVKIVSNAKYLSILAFGVFTLILVYTISGNYLTSEKLASYFWILMMVCCVFFIIAFFRLGESTKEFFTIRLVENNYKLLKVLLSVLFLGILLISGLKKTYVLGGDDTRLYFIYPDLFLKNFASKIVSETALSSVQTMLTPNSMVYTVVFMLVLKTLVGPLNLQSIMYTANLLLGIFAFYIFIKWIIGEKGKLATIIYVLSSFMYVFSIYNFYTLLNSNLMSVFLISTFPFFLHLIFRGISEKKLYFLIPAGVISSVFSYFSLAIPIFAASMVSVIPFLLYFLVRYRSRFIGYFSFLGVFLLILNFYWVVYIPTTSTASANATSLDSGVLSANFREENERGIKAVSDINNVYYPLLNSYHKSIQVNFSWPFLPIYKAWYEKLLPFNFVFIALILLAGCTIRKKNHLTTLYAVSLVAFLWTTYLYTVDITEWGISLFVWLNNNLPGFVMFRNMFDKFSYPLSFNFAFLISVSLILLSKSKINMRKFQIILVIISLLGFLNAFPYLSGWFQKVPLWTTRSIRSETTAFNNDFLELISFMQNSPDPARYVVLPLTAGNTLNIQDPILSNNYYNGASPLVILTGKNDISGSLSFGSLRDVVDKSVREKDYETLGKVLQSINVKYVILNKEVSPELQKSFVYAENFYFFQDQEFISFFLGEKVADFGTRYSIYGINPNYRSEKLYFTQNINEIPDTFEKSSYIRKASHHYEISFNLSTLDQDSNLVFLDTNLSGWNLYDENGNPVGIKSKTLPFGYANAWKLAPDMFKSSGENRKLTLFYDPYHYYWYALSVSILGFVISSIIFIFCLVSHNRKKK